MHYLFDYYEDKVFRKSDVQHKDLKDLELIPIFPTEEFYNSDKTGIVLKRC